MKLILLMLLFPALLNAQKIDTARAKTYILIGTIADFKLLWKAVNDPGNITRKQVADLSLWLNQVREILPDSTKTKHP